MFKNKWADSSTVQYSSSDTRYNQLLILKTLYIRHFKSLQITYYVLKDLDQCSCLWFGKDPIIYDPDDPNKATNNISL